MSNFDSGVINRNLGFLVVIASHFQPVRLSQRQRLNQ